MNRVQFSTYLRGMLGRGYSVADEEHGVDGQVRLVVVRRGKYEGLVVETVDAWIRALGMVPAGEDRVLIKHLAICIRRYFAHPDYLPSHTFVWPGTPRSRMVVRLALDPRKWRRDGAPTTED